MYSTSVLVVAVIDEVIRTDGVKAVRGFGRGQALVDDIPRSERYRLPPNLLKE